MNGNLSVVAKHHTVSSQTSHVDFAKFTRGFRKVHVWISQSSRVDFSNGSKVFSDNDIKKGNASYV